PGWVEEQYAQSRHAWVTADSVSMVYEALSAGCLTGIIPVHWKKPGSRLARSILLVENKGIALSFSKWEKNPLSWPQATKLDEAGRCAREILRRFFPQRLA
ncbi:MAG: ELM1/GtrOC1 family putative glycosyltransferase, partial [Desulfatibacillaceae bacterium]|nr:ELM1/GtrOC1 family putative glycosyltransferase [Desulfatibacillaceae bacterium]